MTKHLTLLAFTLTFAAAPAIARDNLWKVGDGQIHVVSQGTDITTPAGRAQMLALTQAAATKLCHDTPLMRTERACVADTLRETAARSPRGFIAVALAERDGVKLAALADDDRGATGR